MRRSPWSDAGLAGLLALLGAFGTAGADGRSGADRPVDAAGYALFVVAALALAGRRWAPLPTLAVVTVLTSVYLAVGYPYGPMLVCLLIAVYTAARHLPPRVAGAASLLAFGGLMVHVLTNDAALAGVVGVVPASAWVVVPFALGTTLRLNAEAQRRERADQVQQGIAAERLRVAQEVHDVVGHGLAAITMQANVALHLMAKDPTAAATALTAISRTGGEALDELRATIELIGGPEMVPETTAGPGLARLPELVRRMSAAGVQVQIQGLDDVAVPPAADLTAYRVVQEALTNVLRHGDVPAATVTLNFRRDHATTPDHARTRGGDLDGKVHDQELLHDHDEGVEVVVRNRVVGGEGAFDEGVGIRGMRARAEGLGGTLEAGFREGAFEVRAWLPG